MSSTLLIILNWNNAALTIDLIEQFKLTDDNCDYCIIDNNSHEADVTNLVNYIKTTDEYYIGHENDVLTLSRSHKHYLILNRSNDGYAKGNNIGARLASKLNYPYLIVSNNDIKLVEPVIDVLITQLKKNKLAAIAAPKIEDTHGNVQGPFKKETLLHNFLYPLLFPLIIIFKKIGNNPIGDLASTKLKEGDDKLYRLMGCFFAMDTKLFEELGYFDENTFLFYEEAILSAKIFNRNLKIIYYPQIKVVHLDSMTTKQISNKILNYTIQSGRYYFKNYRGYNRFQLFLFSFGKKLHNNVWLKLASLIKK